MQALVFLILSLGIVHTRAFVTPEGKPLGNSLEIFSAGREFQKAGLEQKRSIT